MTVHPDWQAVERRARDRDARLRIALQLVVITFGFVAALLVALGPGSGLARLGEVVLFSLAFLGFPIWASLWRLGVADPRLWLMPAG